MLLVADNIRITNKRIERAVNELNPAPIQEMARRFEAAGADAMDINSGPLSREPVKQMISLVEAVQAVSDLPIPNFLGFHVSAIAGLSNMTSGQGDKEKKRLLESVYLPMLAASGLSMALLNMFHEKTVRIARACNALINQKIFSWEEL
jgi:cobalamin-dependent methionine synthase I